MEVNYRKSKEIEDRNHAKNDDREAPNFIPEDQSNKSSNRSDSAHTYTNTSKKLTFVQPRVLSIQSHVVSGYCGNKSATFPLQLLGFEVDPLNTVQFSNHTQYETFAGYKSNDKEFHQIYDAMKQNNLHSEYTHILTGYVGDSGFLKAIGTVVKDIKDNSANCIYVCDPVLGDNGQLYVPQEFVDIYRNNILSLADIVVPNQFEAELLTGIKITSFEDAKLAMDKIHSLWNIDIVIISSVQLNNEPAEEDMQFKRGENSKINVLKSNVISNISNENDSIINEDLQIKTQGDHKNLEYNFNNDETKTNQIVYDNVYDQNHQEVLTIIASCRSKNQIDHVEILKQQGDFVGTGDLFAALFTAWLNNSNGCIKIALRKTVATIQSVITKTLKDLPSGTLLFEKNNSKYLELKLIQSKLEIENPKWENFVNTLTKKSIVLIK